MASMVSISNSGIRQARSNESDTFAIDFRGTLNLCSRLPQMLTGLTQQVIRVEPGKVEDPAAVAVLFHVSHPRLFNRFEICPHVGSSRAEGAPVVVVENRLVRPSSDSRTIVP